MKDFKRLLSYMRAISEWWGCCWWLVETCFELIIPVLMAQLIDVGVAGHDVPYILGKGVQMGICALLSLICGLLYARLPPARPTGWGARIRQAQYQKVQGYAFSNLDHFETSSLITRMTTDVTVLQTPSTEDCGPWCAALSCC